MPDQPDQPIRLRTERLSWRESGDEVFVMDEQSWEYFSIGGSGVMLWKAIAAGGETRRSLESRLVEAFGIDADLASADTAEFLDLLGERKLLG